MPLQSRQAEEEGEAEYDEDDEAEGKTSNTLRKHESRLRR